MMEKLPYLHDFASAPLCLPLTSHPASPPSAGKPLFGTLISLLHDGVPILGIIDQPVLRER